MNRLDEYVGYLQALLKQKDICYKTEEEYYE